MIEEEQDTLLQISHLTVHYGAAQALFGVDLAVGKGETVALVGANGAGKTSLLKAVMGLLPPSGGKILLDGKDVTGRSPAAMAALGVALCPEGREMIDEHVRRGRPDPASHLRVEFFPDRTEVAQLAMMAGHKFTVGYLGLGKPAADDIP